MTKIKMETTKGVIEFNLFDSVAPKTCENFITHAKNGYYNGIIFHRVIEQFMIQGGDPTGTGRGGESIWGRPFEDECTPIWLLTSQACWQWLMPVLELMAVNFLSRQFRHLGYI